MRRRNGGAGKLLCALLALACCLGAGCRAERADIVVAQQYGVAYAPLEIMKERGMLEERLPGVRIEWQQFGGPTAVGEGMLAGQIDLGFMGIGPALMGMDSGMPWRFAGGLSQNEVALVAGEGVDSLADFGERDRIAVLSPGCTQHILLCMAAQLELGDMSAFDSRIVSLSHPDAMNALLSGTEVTAHFATPPYLDMELEAGLHTVITGEEIVGRPFTFISCVAAQPFYEEKREYYTAFLACLEEAVEELRRNPQECAKTLAPLYGLSEEETLRQMEAARYSTRLTGVEPVAEAMYELGFLQENLPLSRRCYGNVALEGEE